MNKRRKKYIFLILLMITGLVVLITATASSNGGIVINLRMTACSWSDVNLKERLEYYLTVINNVPVVFNEVEGDRQPFEKSGPDLLSLMDDGRRHNGDFLVDINISRIDFETRKVVVFPHIITRYRVFAVLSGSIRVVDLVDKRLTDLKNFEYEIKARDRWQFVDDDVTDFDLHVASDKKIKLIRRLEDKTAIGLFQEIKQLAGGIGVDEQGK
jgi:hypothetical protein